MHNKYNKVTADEWLPREIEENLWREKLNNFYGENDTQIALSLTQRPRLMSKNA